MDEELKVMGFPNEFNQVLLNILSNAKDAFMDNKIYAPLVKIKAFKENGKAVITLTDNAGGIPTDVIGKIFDPYFTTKDKGTGIGLYMCKVIIEKNMGGNLSVRNVEGGVEFRIEV